MHDSRITARLGLGPKLGLGFLVALGLITSLATLSLGHTKDTLDQMSAQAEALELHRDLSGLERTSSSIGSSIDKMVHLRSRRSGKTVLALLAELNLALSKLESHLAESEVVEALGSTRRHADNLVETVDRLRTDLATRIEQETKIAAIEASLIQAAEASDQEAVRRAIDRIELCREAYSLQPDADQFERATTLIAELGFALGEGHEVRLAEFHGALKAWRTMLLGQYFLTHVVIPGHVNEILYSSAALAEEISRKTETDQARWTANANRRFDVALWSLVIAAVAMLSVGFVLAYGVVVPLRRMTSSLHRLGEGDIDIEIPHLDKSDEIGFMARACERFRKRNQEVSTLLEEAQSRQRQLELHAQALEQSRSELEEFAQIASHDLQEPIRQVAACLQMLDKANEGNAEVEGRDFLKHACEASFRMQRRITDLLEVSRFGRIDSEPEPVDLGLILDKVLSDLRSPISEAGAEVERGDLGLVVGYPELLMAALQNLITNAIKYRETTRKCVIWVTLHRHAGHAVIAVRDNGRGIDSKHHQRIFMPFQRVGASNDEESSSSGIGLAVVRRVAKVHGGEVKVSSQPGAGSLFEIEIADDQHLIPNSTRNFSLHSETNRLQESPRSSD